MMLREKAIRKRIERLISGESTPNQIDSVFSDLRFLPGIPPILRDLGDFAAHRPQRDRGHTMETSLQLLENLEQYLSGQTTDYSAKGWYSDEDVVSALKSFLEQTRIFDVGELSDVSPLKTPISLYALATMHGCVLSRKNAPPVTLAIRGGWRTLEIGCTAPMPSRPNSSVNLCVFSTSLPLDTAMGRLREGLPPSDADTPVEVRGVSQLSYLE